MSIYNSDANGREPHPPGTALSERARVEEQENEELRELAGVLVDDMAEWLCAEGVCDRDTLIATWLPKLRPLLQGKREAEARAATAEAELQRAVEVLVHHGCACDWNEASNDPRTHAPEQPCTYHAAVEAQLSEAQQLLGDLLAIIFRDGGQEAATYPTMREAVDAAHLVWAEAQQRVEALESAHAKVYGQRAQGPPGAEQQQQGPPVGGHGVRQPDPAGPGSDEGSSEE